MASPGDSVVPPPPGGHPQYSTAGNRKWKIGRYGYFEGDHVIFVGTWSALGLPEEKYSANNRVFVTRVQGDGASAALDITVGAGDNTR